jgi:hypothetical protein
LVDLITATASPPGSRPSSRTASLLINETTRCGPHWTSTYSITRSATTAVTNPTSRLRAERCTRGIGGGVCVLAGDSASATPSMTRRFDAFRATGNFRCLDPPPDRVLADPSSPAASEILNCGTTEIL